jgi:NADH:ubiquinone oxidoreductase subunit 6 (subunit J)
VIVAVPFVVLAAMAIVGAGGILLCRRAGRCVVSYLLCCSALAGLYGILGMDYIAVIQLVTSLGMAGLFLAFLTSEQAAHARMPDALWCAVIALAFLTLTMYAIFHGSLGEPVLGTLPIWAVPGEHLSTLGSELLERYTILLALLALLLLASILAVAYVIRQTGRAWPRGR